MKEFTYTALPVRVVFGAGALEKLGEEIARLGAQRALVLCTPEQRAVGEDVARRIGSRAAGVYDQAVMHVPIETAEAARRAAAELSADCCIAIGGGSTTGLGKAIALTSSLPILAIPTTFAGSEMTPLQGITIAGVKKMMRDPRMLPRTVIYDPTLLLTLPAGLAGPSGINGIAHAVEALYAQDANPVTSLMAEESIRALAQSLPVVVREPRNVDALGDALHGAWLAGLCLGTVGMALHHKLCHALGGTFNLPHAQTHTVILPHAVRYNAAAAPEAMRRIGRALGVSDPASGLYELARTLGAPVALRDIGMPADGLDRAADVAMNNAYWNPRPLERDAIRELLQAAWKGCRP